MSKFVVVKEAPTMLAKGEIIIVQPTFLSEIEQNSRKAPKHMQTAINHLREVLNTIGQKYDQDMNVFKMRLVNYEGRAYKDNNELSAIFVSLLRSEYPVIFDKVLEFELKNRPLNTKLIYYVGDFNTTGPFYKAGLDFLENKDIESYMTGKPKKVVGKPAISKEEMESYDSES
jgi:hypothetical protein